MTQETVEAGLGCSGEKLVRMHVVLVHFNPCTKTRRGVFRGAREEEVMDVERALAGMPGISPLSPQRCGISYRCGRADGGTS